MKSSTILSLVGVAVVMLVIGTALGSIAFPVTKTETTSFLSSFTSTQTLTIERAFQGLTITEVVVIRTGTLGGVLDCSGNLSANECTGHSEVQVLTGSSTTYIFPTNSTGSYFNITQITSYESPSCPPTTTTSTISFNSTSGLGEEYISWSRSCP